MRRSTTRRRVVSTVAEILREHATRDTPALFFEDRSWTYRQLIAEACRRAALLTELTDPTRPPHVGVLLDNEPDYLFWLAAAALSGSVIVGINSTYRGDQLGQLIRHTDCQLIVTNPDQGGLLDGVDTGVPAGSRHRRRQRRLSGPVGIAADRPPNDERHGGGSVLADLHVRFDRDAEGSALHPRSIRPHGGARGHGRRARHGGSGLHAAAVLPFEFTVHRLVIGDQRRRPGRHAITVLGVGHAGGHPAVERDDAHVHRQGAQLHRRHARTTRRRRQPLASRDRQRGIGS